MAPRMVFVQRAVRPNITLLVHVSPLCGRQQCQQNQTNSQTIGRLSDITHGQAK